ncbi:MAG TPA: hypothetical protein VMT05_07810 [Terriglobales bacterium]|jgi:hypothetical protein|nr:hypothetical protein [Terriglobales bacterium]
MVEEQYASLHSEILCGPTGKLALMNDQSVTKAFIPVGGTYPARRAISDCW